MPKSTVPFNFSQGLDLKTDPKQVQLGKFLALENSVFDKGGLLQKRNGFGPLTTLPSGSGAEYLTTLNGNLTAVGNSVLAYSQSTNQWIESAAYQPMNLSTLPLVRNNLEQVACDSAVAANGLVCTAYTTTNNSTSAMVTNYYFTIANSTTGQVIVPQTLIPPLRTGAISGSSRVFLVGNYFVIVSTVLISSASYLQYIAIPTAAPTSPTSNYASLANVIGPQNATASGEAYVPVTANLAWDGVTDPTTNSLIIGYNTTAGGQGMHVTYLTQSDIASDAEPTAVHAFTNANNIGALVTMCIDLNNGGIGPTNPIFYMFFYNNSNSNVYLCAFYLNTVSGQFTVQVNGSAVFTNIAAANLASAAFDGVFIFVEVTNSYGYDSTIPTNYIEARQGSISSFGSAYTVIRSAGLASKAFYLDGGFYFMGAYQSTYQPSYFLVSAQNTNSGAESTAANPQVIAKLAYENGGGYLTLGLPGVTLSDDTAQLPYLYKDDIEALSTQNNSQQTTAGGIYSQTGVNLASFTFSAELLDSVEIGQNLNLNGGFGWNYDGSNITENDFFLWPDNVNAAYTENSVKTPTATPTSGSNVLTSFSSLTGIYPGMTISGVDIPTGTTVVLVGATTVTMSAAATGSPGSETITFQGNIADKNDSTQIEYAYQWLYEWTDNQGLTQRSAPSIPVFMTTSSSTSTGIATLNIPTLRLTYKTATPIKIVGFRWSTINQNYYQITSITQPLLNSLTADYVTFVDTLSDADIVGNNLIYTTGNVLEDVNPPSFNAVALFDTRAWGINAEDPNELWFTKQIIESTPVEWSDLLTYYIAPNTGTEQTTGPCTAIAPMDDKLVIFKADAIYYINGTGPDNTGANSNYSQPIFITSVVGTVLQQSIVLTPQGLLFQSDKGIWLLGRDLSTNYLGAPVQGLTLEATTNSSLTVPKTNQTRFTMSSGQMLMNDYYYQQWASFALGVPGAESSCIYQGYHTFINQYGSVYQETPGAYLDGTNPVLLGFTTAWINLAALQGFQRFYYFYFLGQYLSPHKLWIGIRYNYVPSVVHSTIITPDNFSASTPSPFGDQPAPFGSSTDFEQWKIHAKIQKCQSFQITVQEMFDPSYGTVAGAGLTLSGINIVASFKKGSRPIPAKYTAG